MERTLALELVDFIQRSPSCYHVTENIKQVLTAEGYEELQESEKWNLSKGGRYFVTRNRSSLIAFQIPEESMHGFQIMASHGDSPTFKLKEAPEMGTEQGYVKLNVEKYGGMIDSSWLDRPLSVAGRLIVSENGGLYTKLVQADQDLLLIPNLAIHMNREINKGYAYQPQTDLLPLFGMDGAKGKFSAWMAKEAGVLEEDVLGMDLFLYNRTPGTVWGVNQEFISSPRLDDLQCAFSSLRGFVEAKSPIAVPVLSVLDNEEVGSATKQGAASTFLKSVLRRICLAFEMGEEDYHRMLAESFMLSADNAHGVHPNRSEKADPTNRPCLNGGIVLKFNGNQKYTTDGVSAAICKSFCQMAGVPWQTYANRSDVPGGSTLGNIANTQTAMNTADIGLAQLAMHSSYETAGAEDVQYMKELARTFFTSAVSCEKDGGYRVITK